MEGKRELENFQKRDFQIFQSTIEMHFQDFSNIHKINGKMHKHTEQDQISLP